jgi:ABC-type multidrug transport system fused ATPase/permease subunit
MWGFLGLGQLTLFVYFFGTLIRAVQSTYNEFNEFILLISPSRREKWAKWTRQVTIWETIWQATINNKPTVNIEILAKKFRALPKDKKSRLPEDKYLRMFCYDYFPDIYSALTSDTSHETIFGIILAYLSYQRHSKKGLGRAIGNGKPIEPISRDYIWVIVILSIFITFYIVELTFLQFTLFIGFITIILLIANEVLKKRMNKLRETE